MTSAAADIASLATRNPSSPQADTTSIIKFLARRYALSPLPGAQGPVSDLSNAFDVTQ
jgi:hypothetical protein